MLLAARPNSVQDPSCWPQKAAKIEAMKEWKELKYRYIAPGDYDRPIRLDLSRAEVIILLNAVLGDLKREYARGYITHPITVLAEALEARLCQDENTNNT